MVKKKSQRLNCLRQQALEQRDAYQPRNPRCWFNQIEDSNPELANEVLALVDDWLSGDQELCEAYTSRKSIARFLKKATQTNVAEHCIDAWIARRSNA